MLNCKGVPKELFKPFEMVWLLEGVWNEELLCATCRAISCACCCVCCCAISCACCCACCCCSGCFCCCCCCGCFLIAFVAVGADAVGATGTAGATAGV